MKAMIKSSEYLMLDDYLVHQVIRTHATKKDAQKYATSIGWPQQHVVAVSRRFEKVWIVASHNIQPSYIAGLEFDTYKCPTGNYETKNGTQQMIVLDAKRYIEKVAK